MQAYISLQTDNHASTPPLKFFYRPDALPATQPQCQSTEGRTSLAENININAQNTPEYKVGGRPGRADTEHVVVAVDFTQQRSLLAAVDNVQRTMGQRLRVLPVNKMVAKNCDILLLNTKLRTNQLHLSS